MLDGDGKGFDLSLEVDDGTVALQLVLVQLKQVQQLLKTTKLQGWLYVIHLATCTDYRKMEVE
jgi:hypothetical protein